MPGTGSLNVTGSRSPPRPARRLNPARAAFARRTYDVGLVWQQLQAVYRRALALKAPAPLATEPTFP